MAGPNGRSAWKSAAERWAKETSVLCYLAMHDNTTTITTNTALILESGIGEILEKKLIIMLNYISQSDRSRYRWCHRPIDCGINDFERNAIKGYLIKL